jgi:hypothetical protein
MPIREGRPAECAPDYVVPVVRNRPIEGCCDVDPFLAGNGAGPRVGMGRSAHRAKIRDSRTPAAQCGDGAGIHGWRVTSGRRSISLVEDLDDMRDPLAAAVEPGPRS